jgi:hypothetical protein
LLPLVVLLLLFSSTIQRGEQIRVTPFYRIERTYQFVTIALVFVLLFVDAMRGVILLVIESVEIAVCCG